MSAFHFFRKGDIERIVGKLAAKEERTKIELAKALNKAARESINLSTKEWNAFSTTPNDYIKNRLKIVSGATKTRLEAQVWARTRATRANNFRYNVMPGRKGVMLNVKRGAGGSVLKNAFVVKAKSDGKPLIIERLKKYQKGDSGFKGGKFKAVYGPSINQHFYDSRERVAPQALSAAKQQFINAMRS